MSTIWGENSLEETIIFLEKPLLRKEIMGIHDQSKPNVSVSEQVEMKWLSEAIPCCIFSPSLTNLPQMIISFCKCLFLNIFFEEIHWFDFWNFLWNFWNFLKKMWICCYTWKRPEEVRGQGHCWIYWLFFPAFDVSTMIGYLPVRIEHLSSLLRRLVGEYQL